MSPRLLLCLPALGLLVLAPACERIPPEVSIPGYAEKHAAEKKAADQPLGAAENPPAFFRNQDEH